MGRTMFISLEPGVFCIAIDGHVGHASGAGHFVGAGHLVRSHGGHAPISHGFEQLFMHACGRGTELLSTYFDMFGGATTSVFKMYRAISGILGHGGIAAFNMYLDISGCCWQVGQMPTVCLLHVVVALVLLLLLLPLLPLLPLPPLTQPHFCATFPHRVHDPVNPSFGDRITSHVTNTPAISPARINNILSAPQDTSQPTFTFMISCYIMGGFFTGQPSIVSYPAPQLFESLSHITSYRPL
jgi:hypothetical protein